MSKRVAKLVIRHSLWISLLLHVFTLFGFSFYLVLHPAPMEKSPEYYVPSYATRGPDQPAPPAPVAPPERQTAQSSQQKQQQGDVQKKLAKSKDGIEKVGTKHAAKMPAPNELQPMPMNAAAKTATSKEDPVHLVGEKKVAKPLVLILGKALAAHLKYPKTAEDFNIRGTAFVGFTLHPDGSVTDVQLVQSSGTGVLDNEAMHGVTTMAPVLHVNQYLQAPEYLIVGVIFG